MRLSKIKIENVRGIASKEIILDIHPNKPTFFVAPNGFGKTSIAAAFNSLHRNRLELPDESRYQNDLTSEPVLEISDNDGNIYRADSATNTITNDFSVFVINSQVKAKASARNFGGFAAATPTLIVEPIVLYTNIPPKEAFIYSLPDMKAALGTSVGKLLINLNTRLKEPSFVKRYFTVRSELAKLLQPRNSSKVEAFLTAVNRINGNATQIANSDIDTTSLLSIDAVIQILDKFDYLFPHHTNIEKLANIIQLRTLYQTNQTKLLAINNYYEYVSDKTEINEMLAFFNCTWKNIKASKKGNQFVIEFPKATQISNGERDILCFVGKLFEARNKLRKNKGILIIDEIFDYLDDANLIAAQYFLIKLIDQYKREGKELFPIILTHLDPAFFHTYSFSTKNIVYLERVSSITNKHKINNLLKDREACKKKDIDLYNRISSNYLHYSIDNTDDCAYLRSIGVEPPLSTPSAFYQAAAEELENYKNQREYDLALVCCGLRIHVEKMAYDQLMPEYRQDFLKTFRTVDKLAFAKEKGASIPEVCFLLSTIYNEAMHLDAQCQKLNPIACKLRNKVIQNMIAQL